MTTKTDSQDLLPCLAEAERLVGNKHLQAVNISARLLVSAMVQAVHVMIVMTVSGLRQHIQSLHCLL